MASKRVYLWILVLVLGLVFSAFVSRFGPQNQTSNLDEGPRPRQEVLDWIEVHFGHDHKVKTALLRLAEAHQYVLTHPDSIMDANDRDSLAMQCLGLAFDGKDDSVDGIPAYQALSAESFNTVARSKKWIAYQSRISGRIYQLPYLKKWDDRCEDPKN